MISQQHFKNQSFLDNSKAASQESTATRPVSPIAEAHKILKQYQQNKTEVPCLDLQSNSEATKPLQIQSQNRVAWKQENQLVGRWK